MNEKMKETKDCTAHTWIPLLGFDKAKIVVPTSLFTCLKCGDLKVGTNTIKISRFRMDMGGLPINSVAGINLTNATNAPVASGLIITATVVNNGAGTPIVTGTPLFMTADGLVAADATTSATSPCVALAIEAGIGSKKVLLHGILRVGTWAKGPGTLGLIYLNTTAGELTQNQPSGGNEVIQPVGWALSDGFIYFSPSMMYLTHM